MTDRELLERAAKAAGIDGQYECWTGQGFMEGIRRNGNPKEFKIWNPLMYDDQALRLAVKSGISIMQEVDRGEVYCDVYGTHPTIGADEPFGSDPYAATRRAIVRAAAAMAEGQTASA